MRDMEFSKPWLFMKQQFIKPQGFAALVRSWQRLYQLRFLFAMRRISGMVILQGIQWNLSTVWRRRYFWIWIFCHVLVIRFRNMSYILKIVLPTYSSYHQDRRTYLIGEAGDGSQRCNRMCSVDVKSLLTPCFSRGEHFLGKSPVHLHIRYKASKWAGGLLAGASIS
jgi:hypothetical protein